MDKPERESSADGSHGRGILVLDMSYTLKMFEQRQLGQALDSRTVGGYFAKVISVHPLAGLFEEGKGRYGPPAVTPLGNGQVFVEGKLGRLSQLARMPRLNFLLAQISLLRLLLRLGRENQMSLVRVGDPYYLGTVGWILARRLRIPLAIRVPFRFDEIRRITGKATMPRLLKYAWIEKAIERFIFPRCDLIAGANDDNMRYALENGGRPEVATVFRYGNLLHQSHWVEPGARPAPDVDLQEIGLANEPFVATVARLEPMKCVEDVVRVIGELARRGCVVRGLIIGDGASRQQLADLARSLGLESTIVFAGYRNQEWIARVLPRAAVIISPHMGRALAEAALSGVPIVAYDYDWQREVVVDGRTGYLIENGDWLGMAARTQHLLLDPAEGRRLGENARTKVARMMDPSALMQHEQDTYSDLLKRWAQQHPQERKSTVRESVG